jgi:hypothetical protein
MHSRARAFRRRCTRERFERVGMGARHVGRTELGNPRPTKRPPAIMKACVCYRTWTTLLNWFVCCNRPGCKFSCRVGLGDRFAELSVLMGPKRSLAGRTDGPQRFNNSVRTHGSLLGVPYLLQSTMTKTIIPLQVRVCLSPPVIMNTRIILWFRRKGEREFCACLLITFNRACFKIRHAREPQLFLIVRDFRCRMC